MHDDLEEKANEESRARKLEWMQSQEVKPNPAPLPIATVEGAEESVEEDEKTK